jgi:poly(3-hydroxybutyrate) depolymerase
MSYAGAMQQQEAARAMGRRSGAIFGAVAWLLLSVACGGEGLDGNGAGETGGADVGPPAPDGSMQLDGGRPRDGGLEPDGGLASDLGTSDVGTGPDLGPEVPLAELVPWDGLGSWYVARVAPGEADPGVGPFIEKDFEVPDATGPFNGLDWNTRSTGDDGRVSVEANNVVYAAARVEVENPIALVVRLTGFELLIDGATFHRPDPYRTGRVMHPIHLAPGVHELVARGGSGTSSIELLEASGPVQPNLQDVTRPDLVPGSRSAQPLGVHVANTSGRRLEDLEAVVLGPEWLDVTVRGQAPVPRDAVTAVTFDLVPVAPIPTTVDTATLTLGLRSSANEAVFTFELPLPIFSGGRSIRRTFVSAVDGSTQYYAVNGPSAPPMDPAALVLSLHGAGVQAAGQARAYETKDWAYVVAPTNRRPFGFDWQDWGRLDALEVLDRALETLPVDPERVHVTGHSMGGHGTWHVGMLHSDRFAVLGPSAGWISFSTYGGATQLPSPWNAARLHDNTLLYRENLTKRAVFMIHGDQDRNVPVQQSRVMLQELAGIPDILELHEEPGAGHWWDSDPRPGATCVDFPALFDLFETRQRNPSQLDFRFTSPAPWVSPSHRFVTVEAVEDPYLPFTVESRGFEGFVSIETTNVASLVVDGSMLLDEGVLDVSVDRNTQPLEDGLMRFGASEKKPGVHGPVKEAFFRPFCFVHMDGDRRWEAVAARLTSVWAVIGNGAGCTLPFSRKDDAGARNRIYLGVPSDQLSLPAGIPFEWNEGQVVLDGNATGRPTFLGVTFPEGDHLAVSLSATEGAEWLARYFSPFSSRAAFPDWFTYVLTDAGNPAYGPSGWFDADWRYDPALRR